MKKIFEIIGLVSLICVSFFITEKTTLVFQNIDTIMTQIRENSINFNKESQDAIIIDDSIIPGKYGYQVDIDKSYKKMKKYGYYNEKLYQYKEVKPNIRLDNNLDKYIVQGNSNNRFVSLVFKAFDSDDINNILDILNKYDVKATFFVDDSWFTRNNDLALQLIKDGHIIGNLSNNLDYQDSSFGWMDTIIKHLGHQNRGYCYYSDNKENIRFCSLLNNYTIKPIEVISNPLLEVKEYLKSGSILSFSINKKVNNEIDSIINFIKNKGYNLVNLEKLLDEK